jgi:hypothetical protein
MEPEKEVGMEGHSGCGAAPAGRTLYPVMTLCLTPPTAANGQGLPWIEAGATGRDEPISVWWDHLPGADS